MLNGNVKMKMSAPAEAAPRGPQCKNALAPYVQEIRHIALQAGWQAPEIGIALLSLAADQLKELGYGQTLN